MAGSASSRYRGSLLDSFAPHHLAEKLTHLPEKLTHLPEMFRRHLSSKSSSTVSVDARGVTVSPAEHHGDDEAVVDREISDIAREMTHARPRPGRAK